MRILLARFSANHRCQCFQQQANSQERPHKFEVISFALARTPSLVGFSLCPGLHLVLVIPPDIILSLCNYCRGLLRANSIFIYSVVCKFHALFCYRSNYPGAWGGFGASREPPQAHVLRTLTNPHGAAPVAGCGLKVLGG